MSRKQLVLFLCGLLTAGCGAPQNKPQPVRLERVMEPTVIVDRVPYDRRLPVDVVIVVRPGHYPSCRPDCHEHHEPAKKRPAPLPDKPKKPEPKKPKPKKLAIT